MEETEHAAVVSCTLHHPKILKSGAELRESLDKGIHQAQRNLMLPCSPQKRPCLTVQEQNQKVSSLRMLQQIPHPPP